MSKQWAGLYSKKDSFWHRSQPQLLFNIGRLLSFGLLGALLGLIGEQLQFSLTVSSVLVLIVSAAMFFLALQMFGVKFGGRIALPKFITRRISDESGWKGRGAPFLVGALTFFLPCGFTITVQGLALLSGNALTGGLIMLLFALGTLPTLLLIGFSSTKFLQSKHWAGTFQKAAGILILFFVIFNVNAQLNVLGLPSLSNVSVGWGETTEVEDLPPIENGVQVVRTIAKARGYEPSYFKIRAGVPVRWEIEDQGTSGCTNAIISKGLFTGEIELTPGEVSVKEFTPEEPGRYKFSCWMGMVSGVVDVVGEGGVPTEAPPTAAELEESSSSSCSGDGSCGGSCGQSDCGCAGN